jgi:iron complex transport system substrate-binding protein
VPQPYPVTVQGSGDQPTVLQQQPERIVALDPGSAELVAAVGAGSRLVGVPADVHLSEATEAQKVVTSTGEIDVEHAIALKPDLIIATQTTDQLDVARIARKSRAAVYVQPAASVRNVEQGAVDIGLLVGEAAQGRQLVGRIQQDTARVEKRLAPDQPVTVFVDTGFFITVSDRSLLGDLVKRAKGKSVAGESPGPGPYAVSDLRRANPEVFLATSDSNTTLKSLRRNPETADLQAVRKGRFVVVPADLVSRAGPNIAAGLAAIARALHPDAFR